MSIRKTDVICQSYRIHGIAYLRGLSLKSIFAELCGKGSGASKGKGGSMHFYNSNLYGGYGIVGSQVPIGTGVAFAMKYKKEDNIALAMYGDGASNQGQVFEAFNMAKLYNLPVVFVCENNQYGMGTSVERSCAEVQLFKRGQIIPGIRVNCKDLPSVIIGTNFAAEHCRSGRGPIILEYFTYRFYGHSMSDPGLR